MAVQAAGLLRPRSGWVALGSVLLALVVCGVLACGLLLFVNQRPSALQPAPFLYPIIAESGGDSDSASRAYSMAGEAAVRVPALVGPPQWRPIAGLDGVSYRWQAVSRDEFQVIFLSDGDYGTKHLEFKAYARDGGQEAEKFEIELLEGEKVLGYHLERIHDLRDVKVGFVRRR